MRMSFVHGIASDSGLLTFLWFDRCCSSGWSLRWSGQVLAGFGRRSYRRFLFSVDWKSFPWVRCRNSCLFWTCSGRCGVFSAWLDRRSFASPSRNRSGRCAGRGRPCFVRWLLLSPVACWRRWAGRRERSWWFPDCTCPCMDRDRASFFEVSLLDLRPSIWIPWCRW